MTGEQRLEKIRADLLAELKQDGFVRWFYISMAGTEGFYGGVFIKARGPVEAWRLLHNLGLYPADRPELGVTTVTHEVPEEKDYLVTEDLQWRLLTLDEVQQIGV